MAEKKKRMMPSFLLGQLLATAQLLEEEMIHHSDPMSNALTVAETYFNDMIEEPAHTLARIEELLAPSRPTLAHSDNQQLVRDMTLIYKIKKQYDIDDSHLNEDEFFKGYYEQLKRYYR